MEDLSLSKLTEGRPGVSVQSIDLHRVTTAAVTVDQLESVGLGKLAIEAVSLPAKLERGSTYLCARIGGSESIDEWEVRWSRIPDEEAPASIRDLNLGPELEHRLRILWNNAAEQLRCTVRIQYFSSNFTSPLIHTRVEILPDARSARLFPLFSFWALEGDSLLSAVSFRKCDAGTIIEIFADLEARSWPDLEGVEHALWQRLLLLCR